MVDSWILIILAFLVLDKVWPLIDSIIQRIAQANSGKLKELLHKRAVLQLEQKGISAQDEYAKWTKNNRKLEQINKQIEAEQKLLLSKADRTKASVKKIKLILITVPFTFLKLYKGKTPVFALPKGIFPNYLQGIFQHGWLYLALGPVNMKRVSDGTSVTVSLAIWIFAFVKVINTIDSIWNTLTAPAIKEPVANTDPIKNYSSLEELHQDHPVD